MAEQNYLSHQMDRLNVSCVFLHPAGWEARESEENDTREVFIVGPRNRADTYTTSLTVKVTPAPEQAPEEAAAELLSRYRTFSSFRELGRATGWWPAIRL
jgi:hypothetical protein